MVTTRNCHLLEKFNLNRHFNVLIVSNYWSLINLKFVGRVERSETRQYQGFKANLVVHKEIAGTAQGSFENSVLVPTCRVLLRSTRPTTHSFFAYISVLALSDTSD